MPEIAKGHRDPRDGMRVAAARLRVAFVSGLGGFLVIFALSQLGSNLHIALLVAPFGASCVLVFALPLSPLAQPRNLIGGHLISSTVGVVILAALGHSPLAYGVAVGLAIAAMQPTDTLHPRPARTPSSSSPQGRRGHSWPCRSWWAAPRSWPQPMSSTDGSPGAATRCIHR